MLKDDNNQDYIGGNIEKSLEAVGEKKINIVKEIISWIIALVSAFVLAFIITNYIIIKAEVPTGSMENSIMPEDRIVGNRMAYLFSNPERGDIVIFKFPDDETQNYVKRVIGLPGETVEIKSGKVYINGNETPLEESYLKEPMRGDDYSFEVPKNSYLMLGDNRNTSVDARAWTNTYVTKDKIIGKVWFRYRPSLGLIK